MPGIYVMAALTIGLTAILSITTLNHLTHSDRRYYWLILAGLPLSLIVNRYIKTPVITSLALWTETPLKLTPSVPLWFIGAILLNSPIFEEAIKVLPLALPFARALLKDPAHSLWTGLALGMGFGLGEAGFLAYGIAQSPVYQDLPWYLFTGFASERLIVTFGHGFLTSLVVFGFHQGKGKGILGYLTAVGLHALINLGPVLMALKLVPAAVSSIGSYVAILGSFLIFQKQARIARKNNSTASGEIIYFEQ